MGRTITVQNKGYAQALEEIGRILAARKGPVLGLEGALVTSEEPRKAMIAAKDSESQQDITTPEGEKWP